MGFTKWLAIHGPGSIGKTTKTCVQAYKDALKSQDEADDEVKADAFAHVISIYTISTRLLQNYEPTEMEIILEASRGCLSMLCFSLICEDFKVVQAMWGSQKHFDIATEVVYETIFANLRTSIVITYPEFRMHSLSYLYYRLSENNYSIDNGNISVTSISYKTAVIDKQTEEIETYESDLLFLAEELYKGFAKKYEPRNYIVWTIEINDNKYKHVHFSTDKSFKENINEHIKRTNGMFKFPGIDINIL